MQRVHAFLSDRHPCFAGLENLLPTNHGAKGNNFFFRWQRPQPDPDRPWDQPAYVQVSIAVDGTVFSYIDAGICKLDPASLPQPTPTAGPTSAPTPAPTTPPPAGYEGWTIAAPREAHPGFRVRRKPSQTGS